MKVTLMKKDKLPFNDDIFNTIILDNVIEHLSDPEKLIIEIIRVTRNNSNLIIGVPGLKGYERDSDHRVFYTRQKLEKLFKKYDCELKKTLHFPFRFPLLSKYLSLYSIFCIFKVYKNT